MNDCIMADLKCPVCLDLCEDPIETGCCHKLLCKSCMEKLENKCVYCRRECNITASVIAKRMINSLPHTCEHCQSKISRGDKIEHALKCGKIPIVCPVCKIKNNKETIFIHLTENHKEELMKNLNTFIDSFNVENASVRKDKISINSQKNGNGLMARLGESGKYYCGAGLDGARCYCCDGFCGLSNGCNCLSCMELDIKSRNLPRGWLVNPAGFNARKFDENGFYYCGRRVMTTNMDCDGYCGPTDGPNCDDCKRLDKTSRTRYNLLIN